MANLATLGRADAAGFTSVQAFHWGLIPSWAKDRKIASKMINARAETLAEKSAFKGLLKKKRCIVPMDGFYEWKPGADGGLDLSADAQCPDAPACTAAATKLTDFVGRQNSMMVRMVTRSLLSGLVIKGNGTKLEATLHATPDQVDAILSLLRAQLGLPPPALRSP